MGDYPKLPKKQMVVMCVCVYLFIYLLIWFICITNNNVIEAPNRYSLDSHAGSTDAGIESKLKYARMRMQNTFCKFVDRQCLRFTNLALP